MKIKIKTVRFLRQVWAKIYEQTRGWAGGRIYLREPTKNNRAILTFRELFDYFVHFSHPVLRQTARPPLPPGRTENIIIITGVNVTRYPNGKINSRPRTVFFTFAKTAVYTPAREFVYETVCPVKKKSAANNDKNTLSMTRSQTPIKILKSPPPAADLIQETERISGGPAQNRMSVVWLKISHYQRNNLVNFFFFFYKNPIYFAPWALVSVINQEGRYNIG